MTATQIPDMKPGSPEWLKRMSASKISAILGFSVYDSPLSMWHKMNGTIPPDPDTNITRRGHYLEPAIRAWFSDQHPDWRIDHPCGTWVNTDRPWQSASPDGIVDLPSDEPRRILECKSATNDWEWGEPGTDEIPLGYMAQVQWQLDTLGLDIAHVAVITSFLDFREYVVTARPDDAAYLREQAQLFLASLREGVQPTLDGHDQTYQAIRKLHPLIDGTDYELDVELAAAYVDALAKFKDAEAAKTYATSRVAAAMGMAKRARFAGTPYAYRQAKKADGSIPYLVAAKGLVQRAGIPA